MFNRKTSVGHLVNWSARLFSRLVDRRLRPLGISSGHITVLLTLEDGVRYQQKALLEHSAAEQSALAATLQRMEKSGLVLRERDPKDGRASLFSLSAEGAGIMDQLHEVLEEGNAIALNGFSEEEKSVLIDSLRRIIDNIQSHIGV